MDEKIGSLIACLVVALSSVSCDRAGAQAPSVPEYRGLEKFDVLAVCYFEDFRGKGSAVSLEYVTQVNIRDLQALSKEVDEVWRDFQSEAERLHAKQALINPNSSRSGGISTPFVFELSEGGWTKRGPGTPRK